MSSNEDNGSENEDDDETISENKKTKRLNDTSDEIIDKSKSLEQQIKLEDLKWHCPCDDFFDKDVESKYFKIELPDITNGIDKKLFKQIFGHALETLANKLINPINKEENQTIVNRNNKNEQKLCEKCETSYGRDWWSNQTVNVLIYLMLLNLL